MDLPTYTNIWRIEKRLYKLYDLRLPMPLPLVQIGVFVGVFLPWILLLRFIGIPFHTPWHVLYLVPPGVLTWLATRPVIEGKRLTELLLSHTRYLTEPRTWCRLTPIREPREVVVVARVWRQADGTTDALSRAERSAVTPAAQTREAQGRGRHVGSNAPSPVPSPARATPRTVGGPPLGSSAESGPARAAGPRPLQEYATHSGLDSGTGGQGGLGVPAGFGAQVHAAPSAASAWRPRTRRNISHEPDMAVEPEPMSDGASDPYSQQAEPPPAMRLPDAPRVPGPRPDGERGLPDAPDSTAVAGSPALGARTTEPAEHAQSDQSGTAAGSAKRGVASGVRRPGAPMEVWKAIAPREQAPADGPARRSDVPVAETPGPEIPAVPGAFGASDTATEGQVQAGEAEPEPRQAEHPAGETARAEGPAAPGAGRPLRGGAS
ncbi:MAG: ATPase involved in chromosome partitioning-like protein [Streptosporangiaceae bacterium]|nr:ATPase involved in chromosome partitioning-like protein [Streptosporangiaceae bacterium]